MIKVFIKSIGCKVNQAESEEMMKILSVDGALSVKSEKEADICIINTCTVTQRADSDSRNAVRRAVKNNPSCRLIVTGCYSKLYPDEFHRIRGVDAVAGNSEKRNISQIVQNVLSGKDAEKIKKNGGDGVFIASSHSENSSRTRAFLKVQDGCDCACTYCIVPKARGKSRSASVAESADAFRKLIDEGYREVVLTGIHLGNFGKGSGESLEKLLERLILTEGDYRIRLSSIEPREVSGGLMEIIASTDKIAPYLHIPLQSGDDDVLLAMGRNYDTSFFEELIGKICSNIEGVNIGLDVIAGFPGESDEQFMGTYKFIERIPVGYLHVFSYSDRRGTEASKLEGKVSSLKIKERSEMLRELGRRKKNEFRKEFIGKSARVLVERKARGKENLWKGLTDNYIPVIFEGGAETRKNEFVNVSVFRFAENEVLEGKIN